VNEITPFDFRGHAVMTCPDCRGARIDPTDGLPCEWCGGAGEYEPTLPTAAQLNARVRFEMRCLEEPMYQVAVGVLLGRKLDGCAAEAARRVA